MKISRLIARLETVQKKYGNVDVEILDPAENEKGNIVGTQPYLSLYENEKGKVVAVTLVDKETAIAFS